MRPRAEKSPEVLCVRNAMDETGVDFAMDIHGDEAIPANFLAGFEGIPSLTERQTQSVQPCSATRSSGCRPTSRPRQGYEVPAPGEANMSMSTTQLAERYGCVSMTLEMPFKDNFDLPDPVYGWSPERSKYLAGACLDALHAILPELKKAKARRADADARPPPARPVAVEPARTASPAGGTSDLSTQGIAEARAAGALLTERGFDFDLCFTSVLTRAIRTLHLVLHEMDRLWLPVSKHWRLNERHYGGLTGLNKQEMIDQVGAEQVKIWRRSFDIPPPPLPADSPCNVSRRPPLRRDRGARQRKPQGHDRARSALL